MAEIAFSLNALAGTYFSQGDTDGAKRLCQTAYHLYKIALGDNHPDTMVVAENLKKLEQKEAPPEGPKLPKLKIQQAPGLNSRANSTLSMLCSRIRISSRTYSIWEWEDLKSHNSPNLTERATRCHSLR
ncbi:MAG: tetratricopeptide repeat protein [Cyanobacteriota/Melainabacteria group bacterium]